MPPPAPQTALVTGAAGGIGRAVVARLAATGVKVLATDVVTELAPPPGGAWRRLDVTDYAAWRDAVADATARWGGLDLLVNNAGVVTRGAFLDLEPADIERQLAVNLRGAALGTHAAGRAMRARGRGHVVNVTSLAGVIPATEIAAYTAGKFGLRGLSLAVGAELAGAGVAVTAVGPFFVDTPMVTAQFGEDGAHREVLGPWLLTPDEVARVIVDEVLVTRPAERLIPYGLGVVGRVIGAVPWLGRALIPRLLAWQERRVAARRGR